MQYRPQSGYFYRNQCAYMRDKIKQIQFNIQQEAALQNKNSFANLDVNILVIGPSRSGKTSFLQTLQKSYNNGQIVNPEQPSKNINYKQKKILSNSMTLQSTTIKQSTLTKNIKGLSSLSKINQNSLSIKCHEITEIYMQNTKNPYYYDDKYGFTYCLVDQNMFFKYCFGNLANIQGKQDIKKIDAVVICLPMTEKVNKKQLKALNSFIIGLQQSCIQFWIVGTGIDKIIKKGAPKLQSIHRNINLSVQYSRLNSSNKPEINNSNKKSVISLKNAHISITQSPTPLKYANKSVTMSISDSYENLNYIQQWKKNIIKKFNVFKEERIYCLENYRVHTNYLAKQNTQTVQNQVIDFYSLRILNDMISVVLKNKKNQVNNGFTCC